MSRSQMLHSRLPGSAWVQRTRIKPHIDFGDGFVTDFDLSCFSPGST